MSSFILLHRSKDQIGSLPAGVESVWATCLREIAFLADGEEIPHELSQIAEGDVKGVDVHTDAAAYEFLLGILCGLKSPVLGETEVLGQFKAYLNSLENGHPLKRDPTTIPFLLNVVKEARSKFLSATGSLTYGQIVRRWLKDARTVALWGFGSLGSEIHPWIREKTTAVVTRTPRVVDGIPFTTKFEGVCEAHVIAAPLDDETVRALAEHARVIDLRDRPLQGLENVRNLADLFREIRELRREREEILPRCEEFLRRRVNEHMERTQIRPFGWEDLCG